MAGNVYSFHKTMLFHYLTPSRRQLPLARIDLKPRQIFEDLWVVESVHLVRVLVVLATESAR